MENAINIIGFTAGVLTSISIFPQLMKTWKTKAVNDVSLGMFVVYDIGLFLWIAYGYLIGSFPVLIMNSVAFMTSIAMTYLIIRYRK